MPTTRARRRPRNARERLGEFVSYYRMCAGNARMSAWAWEQELAAAQAALAANTRAAYGLFDASAMRRARNNAAHSVITARIELATERLHEAQALEQHHLHTARQYLAILRNSH